MTELLDHNPVPRTGPRNLTVPLAAWLRRLGFTVIEHGGVAPHSLTAIWRFGARCYLLTYIHKATEGCLRLTLDDGPGVAPRTLVAGAAVHRLREARFLLLSSTSYAGSRRAALECGALLPAHQLTADA